MNYREYCSEYYSEEELTSVVFFLISADVKIKPNNIFEFILYQFISLQHYATLTAYGFCYMGLEDDGFLFEWKNEISDWEACIKPYRIGCVVTKKKTDRYTLRIYNMETGNYSTETFDKAYEAIKRIQDVLDIKGTPELPKFPEMYEREHQSPNSNDVKTMREHVNKKLNILRKNLSCKFDHDVVSNRMKFINKLIYRMFKDYSGQYIKYITTKDNNIRITCFSKSNKQASINISTDVHDYVMTVIVNNKEIYKSNNYEEISSIIKYVVLNN